MSTDTSASPSRALRSPSRIIASGTAASHESPSLQSTTGRTSFVSPSPGFPYTSSQGTSSMLINQGSPPMHRHPIGPRFSSLVLRRRRLLESIDDNQRLSENQLGTSPSSPRRHVEDSVATAQSLSARKLNDSLVYLDGPQIYTCAQCRTHLTSHDEIISKSFHGRHGRAYLFDHCVNVKIGPAEDRLLITGLHSVNDIFCKRCKNMIGWTYSRAYEHSQKYKEGKFIVEKVNLHLEESDYYDVAPPAGERKDRFRARSISWGSDARPRCGGNSGEAMVYEYRPSSTTSSTSHLG